MKTAQWVHAELSARTPSGERVRPLTAIEILLCEAIDRLEKRVSDAHTKLHNLSTRGRDE